jgi:hypothetical protein
MAGQGGGGASKKPLLPPLDTGPLPLAPIRDAARKQLIDVIDSVRRATLRGFLKRGVFAAAATPDADAPARRRRRSRSPRFSGKQERWLAWAVANEEAPKLENGGATTPPPAKPRRD